MFPKSSIAAENYSVKGENQPYFHGFNAEQMLNWSPETDTTAKYFRSNTPLEKRNSSYAATQAQPQLKNNAALFTLSGDYGDPGYRKEKGMPDFTRTVDAYSRNVFQFWQYVDYYASWNGVPIEGTSYSDIKENQNLTYGVVNYPNPAYTDAAHRNGVKSLGAWFWPRKENFSKWVVQKEDKSFPVADKMIALARYMNFDGYFINQEATISKKDAQQLQAMLVYFKKKAPDLYIQFYDSLTKDGELDYVNGFDKTNSYWVKAANGSAADSIFMNYAWNTETLKKGNQYAKSVGLDPLRVMFAGTENQKYGFNPPYDPRQVFADKTNPFASWALFGSDFVYSRYPGNNLATENQLAINNREREYWSGPKQDPTKTGRLTEENSSPYSDDGQPNDANNPAHWDGVANFIAEKTVIQSFPFVTNFNTGHGLGFYQNGKQVSKREWSNIGIQDILPTWQWWQNGKSKILYNYTNAWNGGNSLEIKNIQEKSITHLFKLDAKLQGKEELVLRAIAPPSIKAQILIYFKDDLSNPVAYNIKKSNQWNLSKFNLRKHKQREIGKISISIKGKANESLVIGQLGIVNKGNDLLGKPTFEVERYLGESGEAFIKTTMAKDILYYNVSDEKGMFIGRVNSQDSYLNHIPKGTAKLVVQPVSKSYLNYKQIIVPLKNK
ncbi:endo-beta-N-acetylglucosaminidase [Listeria ivanovii]|uniref:endo-beta-N-acetylglucosaminidase n=1 Tax=Listeria ivanovii TaxID=1638 RepID=UPI0015E8CC3B|nr:hypothetical protein [Listeria ivanovii]